MAVSLEEIRSRLAALDGRDAEGAPRLVDLILDCAVDWGVTDVHLRPTSEGLEWRWRLDGVLHDVGLIPAALSANVVARLKVLADLLTYRTDVPQEGRIRRVKPHVEMRISTFPTLFGEKAVIRLFAPTVEFQYLDELGFPVEVVERLQSLMTETSGALLVAGPAGSGKTTTIYACLREIAKTSSGRNLVSLEDPIEVEVAGVAQAQVNPTAGFDLTTGLRFLLRQDPEVIMVSEIRDRDVAETVFQAALTGHLVLSTFHAGSAATAINRLSEMGIEPYVLRSGILAILSQRLVRRLCHCARPSHDAAARLGLDVDRVHLPQGCEVCHYSGYRGRLPLVELLTIEPSPISQAVLARDDSLTLERQAIEQGMVTRWQRAREAVAQGLTSPAEVRRVLGFSDR